MPVAAMEGWRYITKGCNVLNVMPAMLERKATVLASKTNTEKHLERLQRPNY